MSEPRQRWNQPAVTSERFDDEVVVVNFDSGKYHSIQGAGVLLWQWLGLRPTVEELVDLAVASLDGPADQTAAAVRAFVADLTREGLIVSADPAAGGGPSAPASPRTPFRAPVLTTFSDMQELLWLDPIHEVDDTGWPVARNDALD
jgi:Coenzyme PQQ synthesis protein D (PqqD)